MRKLSECLDELQLSFPDVTIPVPRRVMAVHEASETPAPDLPRVTMDRRGDDDRFGASLEYVHGVGLCAVRYSVDDL